MSTGLSSAKSAKTGLTSRAITSPASSGARNMAHENGVRPAMVTGSAGTASGSLGTVVTTRGGRLTAMVPRSDTRGGRSAPAWAHASADRTVARTAPNCSSW